MDSQLNIVHSETRTADLLDQSFRFEGPIRSWAAAAAVTVRAAGPGDAGAVQRLAALDDRPLPDGQLLIGEVGARPLAALSLADNTVVADPFMPTREVVALLRLRARQLQGRRLGARRISRWRARLVL